MAVPDPIRRPGRPRRSAAASATSPTRLLARNQRCVVGVGGGGGGGGSAGRNDKPNVIPESCTTVIIIAQEMDSPLLSTVPSALSGAATGLGYSHDAVVLLAVAQYLKNLGGRSIKRIPQPKA